MTTLIGWILNRENGIILKDPRKKTESDTDNKGKRTAVSPWRLWYRAILAFIAVAAVAWYLNRNFRRLADFEFNINIAYLIPAFFSVSAAYFSSFLIWTRLATVFGLKGSFSGSGRAYFLSYLGRYIPGKVGLILARIEAYPAGSAPEVIMATGLEQVAVLSAASLLVILALAVSPAFFPREYRLLALGGIVPLLILLIPGVLNRIARLVYRIFRREALEIKTSYSTNLRFTVLYILPSIFHGLGLFFILKALSIISWSYFIPVAGLYSAAMLLGLFAVFVPGGIGVREGLLFAFLPAVVSVEAAMISAVVIRVVTIVVEVILAAGFIIVARTGSGHRAGIAE
ncbi:MAG: flippase-like domain-containing protein [Candidatus Krumholzibacteriota bacterium]|nr:flippase-like domain-containing protein [Candidatus Krumholzibacteriota bacterium]